MSRKIEDLVPELQCKARAFQALMQERGIDFIFTQTKRTHSEQCALWAQGRESLETVNQLRKVADLAPIIAKENFKVTWTMKSKHLEGKAFDIAIKRDGKILWSSFLFDQAGEIGKSLGLVWGGDFKGRTDKPHFELKEE